MATLIINPPRYQGLPVIREDRCEIVERHSLLPSYSLMQLATVLKKRESATYVDANAFSYGLKEITGILKQHAFDRMIFRFTPQTMEADMQIANACKRVSPGTRIEAVNFTLRKDHERIRRRYGLHAVRTMDAYFTGFPQPEYASIPSLPYHARGSRHPFTITYASKGCPFACPFCTSAKSTVRFRDLSEIRKEVRMLKRRYGLRSVSFFDETFTLDRARTKRLCSMLAREEVHWTCNTRTELVDEALLEEMKLAGCEGISFGIESGAQKMLSAMRKATLSQHIMAVHLCRALGIKTHCSFIFGLPGETQRTAEDTLKLLKSLRPHSAQFNLFVPYPATAYGDQYANGTNDALFRQDLSSRSYCGLSVAQLHSLRRRAYRQLHLDPGWMTANLMHILRYPKDIPVACRYYIGSLADHAFHSMEHVH